jgi:hypothetical protein
MNMLLFTVQYGKQDEVSQSMYSSNHLMRVRVAAKGVQGCGGDAIWRWSPRGGEPQQSPPLARRCPPPAPPSLPSTTLPSHCVPETATKLQQGRISLDSESMQHFHKRIRKHQLERMSDHRSSSSDPSYSSSQETLQ